jgi:hypothetical protein
MNGHRGPCLGCGHAEHNHMDGGLCLVASCRLCLIYRPPVDAEDQSVR